MKRNIQKKKDINNKNKMNLLISFLAKNGLEFNCFT